MFLWVFVVKINVSILCCWTR